MTFPTVFYSRLISLIMGKKSPYLNEDFVCLPVNIATLEVGLHDYDRNHNCRLFP